MNREFKLISESKERFEYELKKAMENGWHVFKNVVVTETNSSFSSFPLYTILLIRY